MKRRLLRFVLPLLAAALPASALSAQQIVPFLGGGAVLGTGDLGEDSSVGWLVLGGFDVPLPTVDEAFAVGVAGSFAKVPFEGGFGEAMQVTSVTAELSYLFGDLNASVRPYLRGGAGVQIHRYEPGDTNFDPITDHRAGFTAGAGVRIAMGEADAMIGARFQSGTDGGFLGGHVGVAIPVGP